MAYTPPLDTAVILSFTGAAAYTPPSDTAVNLQFLDTTVGTWSMVCSTVPAFAGATVTPSVASVEGVSEAIWLNSDRVGTFDGVATADFINPDRHTAITTGTSLNIIGRGYGVGVVASSCGAVAAYIGEAVGAGTMQCIGSTAGAMVGEATAVTRFRTSGETKLNLSPLFEKISYFTIINKTTVKPATVYKGDMRLRLRSRTIMRFRSGPWPW